LIDTRYLFFVYIKPCQQLKSCDVEIGMIGLLAVFFTKFSVEGPHCGLIVIHIGPVLSPLHLKLRSDFMFL
jgi:hypothetical protein